MLDGRCGKSASEFRYKTRIIFRMLWGSDAASCISISGYKVCFPWRQVSCGPQSAQIVQSPSSESLKTTQDKARSSTADLGAGSTLGKIQASLPSWIAPWLQGDEWEETQTQFLLILDAVGNKILLWKPRHFFWHKYFTDPKWFSPDISFNLVLFLSLWIHLVESHAIKLSHPH